MTECAYNAVMEAASELISTVGTPVDVWCESLSDWSRGFAVHEVGGAGVLVRRLSDGVVLPERFELTQVRPTVAVTRTPTWR